MFQYFSTFSTMRRFAMKALKPANVILFLGVKKANVNCHLNYYKMQVLCIFPFYYRSNSKANYVHKEHEARFKMSVGG